MARPTGRGLGLLVVAAATYLAARSFGTWELYLLSVTLLVVLAASWLLVLVAAPRLEITRTPVPERPVAGERFGLSFRVRNRSWLPGLQVDLPTAGGDLGGVELEPLGPYGMRTISTPRRAARRGVHYLPPLVAEAYDPFGLAHARRRLGESQRITVYPRLAELHTCLLFPDLGTRRGRQPHGLPTLGGSEFRSIRPHQAGEPLSRVDWKATARTGSLMLRETDDPTSGDLAVLLEQASGLVAGDDPDTSFELAVQAAGSVADYGLRAGRGVRLLLQAGGRRVARLAPDADGRRRLLELLAEVSPQSLPPLGASLRTLLIDGRPLSRSRSLTLVVMRLDRELVGRLTAFHGRGRVMSVVHVDPTSFSSADGQSYATEAGRLRLALVAAGIPVVTLRRGDDLRTALAQPVESARGGGPASYRLSIRGAAR